MGQTLEQQRPLEQNVHSVNSFFVEAGLDGEANSVYVINHNPVRDELSTRLGETCIQEMTPSPDLGDAHPLFGTSVMRDKDTGRLVDLPITFRKFEDKQVIQTMCAAMALGANLLGQQQMVYWAARADQSLAVAFVNVDPSLCGPDPLDLKSLGTILRRNYTNPSETFQSIAAVANHGIVRWRLKEYGEETDVVAFPAFALLGKIYHQEKADVGKSMTCSPINPEEDRMKEGWMAKPPTLAAGRTRSVLSPWLLDSRQAFNDTNVIFIDTSDNRLGDDVLHNFNSACSAWSVNRVPFTLKLGANWLRKVITHHLLQNAGAPKDDQAAQNVGRSLNEKLALMASSGKAKPFLQASVDWRKSRCVQMNGRPCQTHEVYVKYREGVEDFHIRVEVVH